MLIPLLEDASTPTKSGGVGLVCKIINNYYCRHTLVRSLNYVARSSYSLYSSQDMHSSRKRRRESQFARKVVAIKNEFKILLGTLDPVSSFNYLHYEGIVSKSDKEDFEKHLSTSYTNSGMGKKITSVSSVEEGKKPVKIDDKLRQAAREKLTEIVDKKDDHKELQAIVIGLNAFKKLHQSAVDRRQTYQPQGIL